VNGWRKLPHLTREVEALFDYPQQFAADTFCRIDHELSTRVADDEANAVDQTGHLYVSSADSIEAASETSLIPELPVRYIRSSDRQLVAAQRADASDEAELLRDRREGKFILSYMTPGGWVAITKASLTEVLGAGRDAKIIGLPGEAADALKLMYSGLVISSGE
jgi:hypothetical protein